MDNYNKQVYNWVVKQGNITLYADNDKIHFEINKESNPTCLLNKSDAEEIISILTDIARNIWDNPAYTKEPYNGKLYTLDENGNAYWNINETMLLIGLNEAQDALEINFQGSPVMKVPVNFSIEMIQIMNQFSNRL